MKALYFEVVQTLCCNSKNKEKDEAVVIHSQHPEEI